MQQHTVFPSRTKYFYMSRFRDTEQEEQCTSNRKLTDQFNPLSPKSDQHQISPCNINALQHRVVMRITDMITQDVFA